MWRAWNISCRNESPSYLPVATDLTLKQPISKYQKPSLPLYLFPSLSPPLSLSVPHWPMHGTNMYTHLFGMMDKARYVYIYTATPRSGNMPSYKLKGMNLSPWQCLSLEFRQLISYKCFVPEWFLSSSSTCCKYVSERQHAKFVAAKPLKIEMSWLRNSVLIVFF